MRGAALSKRAAGLAAIESHRIEVNQPGNLQLSLK